ncbi:von Willebrand factor type A domain protein [Phycisphaerae bacterium RAS2]|nr:von Willebrand factor type A domain protein [Phycisphaerae bacterium RAS2]
MKPSSSKRPPADTTSPDASVVLRRPTPAHRLVADNSTGSAAPSANPLHMPTATADSLPMRTRRTVIVVDASGSMMERDWPPNRLWGATNAAQDYADASAQCGARNEVAVVAYGECARIMCCFISCGARKELQVALGAIGMYGATNIAAGLEAAEHLFIPFTHSGAGDELVVLLLTDGKHNCRSNPVEWADRLKSLGVVIDAVGIGGDHAQVDEALLRRLASEDGDGRIRYRFIGDPERLAAHYRQMAGRLTR